MNRKPLLLKLARPVYKLIKPLIPVASRYAMVYREMKINGMYHAGATTIKDFCFVEKDLKNQPLISVIVPVFNPRTVHLLEMTFSVVNQHYGNWELILVNASSDPHLRKKTKDLENVDTRIKIINVDNQGIADNTNKGVEMATGEFIAFLDHDDLLHPCALHSIAETLQVRKDPTDLVYTDEDKINESGDRFFEPHYKPGWSPDLLRNVNYINHLTAVRAEFVKKVGGLRPKCDGAQDYDLLLRIIDECRPTIRHMPRVLYHWRAAAGSTAQDISTKNYIFQAGKTALNDHLKRNKLKASAEPIKGKPGFYEIKYKPVEFSVVIGPVVASKHGACAAWLNDLCENLPGNSELVIGDWYKNFKNSARAGTKNIKYIKESEAYWQKAASAASKEVCICFKIAALPKTQSGLADLAAAAQGRKAVVMPPIISEDKTIYNSGIINVSGIPQKLFEGYKFGRYTFFGNTDWVRNVDNMGINIVAIKTSILRTLLEDLGGDFSEYATMGELVYRKDKPRFIVWAHSPFEYKGPLQFKRDNFYHQVAQARFVPAPVMYIDNWGEKYERDEQ